MTDSTGESLTRDEAIDRMKAGLPCETYINNGVINGLWMATKFAHFDSGFSVFRKPPEPRRVAREYRDVWVINTRTGYEHFDPPIHVREVLPSDVVCERMTRNEARTKLREWGVSNNYAAGGAMTTLIELGLIGEGS